jgi:L-rhamnose isomerase/sugar isomerase
VFCELTGGGRPLPRLTIDQSHNIEAKVEAMVMSVVNIQDAYARALIVDREALRAASASGDVLAGHQTLIDAYNTDVRPLCASARRARGAADDPVQALRSSGRSERVAAERAAGDAVRGAR